MIASAGFQADMKALHKMLQARAGLGCRGAGSAAASFGDKVSASGSTPVLAICWVAACSVDTRAGAPPVPTRHPDPPPSQGRNVTYQHSHGKPMSCPATAQLLSNTLYHRRFFPLYTFNLCVGLDEEGGCLAVEGLEKKRAVMAPADPHSLQRTPPALLPNRPDRAANPPNRPNHCAKTAKPTPPRPKHPAPNTPPQPTTTTTPQARAPSTPTTPSDPMSARATRARAAARTSCSPSWTTSSRRPARCWCRRGWGGERPRAPQGLRIRASARTAVLTCCDAMRVVLCPAHLPARGALSNRPPPHPQNSVTDLPLEQAVDLVKDAFVSAGERDIYTVRALPRPRARRRKLDPRPGRRGTARALGSRLALRSRPSRSPPAPAPPPRTPPRPGRRAPAPSPEARPPRAAPLPARPRRRRATPSRSL